MRHYGQLVMTTDHAQMMIESLCFNHFLKIHFIRQLNIQCTMRLWSATFSSQAINICLFTPKLKATQFLRFVAAQLINKIVIDFTY